MSRRMTRQLIRWLIGAVGVLVGGYGAYLLLSRQDLEQLRNAAVWLVSGVVLHDLVLAPVVLVVSAAAGRLLPGRVRGPAAMGAVVLGSVTLLAIPVLGRFGAHADNQSLLDRDYAAGWFLLAGLTLVGVGVATLASRRRTRSGTVER